MGRSLAVHASMGMAARATVHASIILLWHIGIDTGSMLPTRVGTRVRTHV